MIVTAALLMESERVALYLYVPGVVAMNCTLPLLSDVIPLKLAPETALKSPSPSLPVTTKFMLCPTDSVAVAGETLRK